MSVLADGDLVDKSDSDGPESSPKQQGKAEADSDDEKNPSAQVAPLQLGPQFEEWKKTVREAIKSSPKEGDRKEPSPVPSPKEGSGASPSPTSSGSEISAEVRKKRLAELYKDQKTKQKSKMMQQGMVHAAASVAAPTPASPPVAVAAASPAHVAAPSPVVVAQPVIMREGEDPKVPKVVAAIFDPNADKKKEETVPTPVRAMPNYDQSQLLVVPPKGVTVLCFVRRIKKALGYPEYELFLDNSDKRFLMAGKKRTGNKTPNYMISRTQHQFEKGEHMLGKLRSNFLGTEFYLYDNGINPERSEKPESEGSTPRGAPPASPLDPTKVRAQLAAIVFAPNFLGHKGPRKMEAILPALDASNTKPKIHRPVAAKDSLVELKTRLPHVDVLTAVNKEAEFKEEIGSYVLDFRGRVTKASVKNFQLVRPEEPREIILQFGKRDDEEFALDFTWPLCPMQAFGICLAACDYKFAMQ